MTQPGGPESSRSAAADGRELAGLDAITLAGLLRARQVSAREVTAAHIERVEAVDGAVNAIVTRTFETALQRAAAADEALARGAEPGLLHGLPVAHKDLLETAGVRTTYGSPLFADWVPARDELIVARMAGAGAISLGKTNTPEFGAGSHTVNPVFGATRNPYDLTRSAGGSSGGAAAALAARMICLADGSDLGGSLRNPASFCNVVGLRPSPGRVPRWPTAEVADVLGVEGPMGRTVADVALLLAVQSGPDPRVPLALDAPPPAITAPAQVPQLLARDLRGLRVAWSPDLGLPVAADVLAALAPARAVLAGLGCRELAPVNAGLVVMGCVIAVVEQHEIGEAADKIPGMVEVGFFVRVHMLDIIEQHHDKEGYLLGDHDIQQGFTPVEEEGAYQ